MHVLLTIIHNIIICINDTIIILTCFMSVHKYILIDMNNIIKIIYSNFVFAK